MIILNDPNGRILEKVDNHEINEDGSFDIADDITAIAENAFYDLPAGQISIGSSAFSGVGNL
ncbi:hypothetical protein [Legionella drozanskii]|uniref:Uncharacterized protein n=1 Tax=Legionella drozanskii LLAP-1 TaxID=1212489 RepID=A0A0W0SR63_9GAMM|nr:hypothetical protein [Legionella drozanskii]KTC85745.1 hypothetical protein Ldro_2070 [Legionella drozanskii LLAP-1]